MWRSTAMVCYGYVGKNESQIPAYDASRDRWRDGQACISPRPSLQDLVQDTARCAYMHAVVCEICLQRQSRPSASLLSIYMHRTYLSDLEPCSLTQAHRWQRVSQRVGRPCSISAGLGSSPFNIRKIDRLCDRTQVSSFILLSHYRTCKKEFQNYWNFFQICQMQNTRSLSPSGMDATKVQNTACTASAAFLKEVTVLLRAAPVPSNDTQESKNCFVHYCAGTVQYSCIVEKHHRKQKWIMICFQKSPFEILEPMSVCHYYGAIREWRRCQRGIWRKMDSIFCNSKNSSTIASPSGIQSSKSYYEGSPVYVWLTREAGWLCRPCRERSWRISWRGSRNVWAFDLGRANSDPSSKLSHYDRVFCMLVAFHPFSASSHSVHSASRPCHLGDLHQVFITQKSRLYQCLHPRMMWDSALSSCPQPYTWQLWLKNVKRKSCFEAVFYLKCKQCKMRGCCTWMTWS